MPSCTVSEMKQRAVQASSDEREFVCTFLDSTEHTVLAKPYQCSVKKALSEQTGIERDCITLLYADGNAIEQGRIAEGTTAVFVIVEVQSDEEEELPGELCFCTEELTTVSYMMHSAEPGFSYMVQYDADGHQKCVYIQDNNGMRLQEAKRIFYHNDNPDQLRCEHHAFEDSNWTELTYCK